jgi:CopG-like RHH_1 or ribbon-helix-helix domain, RHH_5
MAGSNPGKKGTMRTTTGVSLPVGLKEAAERQARREHRSLSSLISFALDRYLREMSAWTDPKPDDAEGR